MKYEVTQFIKKIIHKERGEKTRKESDEGQSKSQDCQENR